MDIQITIDCVDRQRLAACYERAEVGDVTADRTANVRQLLEDGLIGSDQVVDLGDRQGLAGTAACSDPSGRVPRLHVPRVPETKSAKNRIHVDLQIPGDSDARDDLVGRFVRIGARRVDAGSHRPWHVWVELADPDDDECDVSN